MLTLSLSLYLVYSPTQLLPTDALDGESGKREKIISQMMSAAILISLSFTQISLLLNKWHVIVSRAVKVKSTTCVIVDRLKACKRAMKLIYFVTSEKCSHQERLLQLSKGIFTIAVVIDLIHVARIFARCRWSYNSRCHLYLIDILYLL